MIIIYVHNMRIRRLPLCLTSLALCLIPGGAQSQTRGPGIWDQRIAPQPFETRPFHAIRIPEWVRATTGCGYTLSVLDHDGRATAVEHGVTISEVGFVDPLYAY